MRVGVCVCMRMRCSTKNTHTPHQHTTHTVKQSCISGGGSLLQKALARLRIILKSTILFRTQNAIRQPLNAYLNALLVLFNGWTLRIQVLDQYSI